MCQDRPAAGALAGSGQRYNYLALCQCSAPRSARASALAAWQASMRSRPSLPVHCCQWRRIMQCSLRIRYRYRKGVCELVFVYRYC